MGHELSQFIRNVPDFPKPGVMFKDISPLLRERFPETIKAMANLVDWNNVDYILGIESRGFILGSGLASIQNKGLIPVRKKGKLPPPTFKADYALEYGTDTLEISALGPTKSKVLIVDDVLATGGTYQAAVNLCLQANLTPVGGLFLINLTFLNDLEKSQQPHPVYSLFRY
jgi:adenine phosphoribosyltransferase